MPGNMIILISHLIFVVAVSKCSVIMEENNQKNYSKYCDKMENCGNITHVMCMHYKSNGAMGPSCVESRQVDLTNQTKQHILSVINGFRIRVAKGEETGKYGEALPKAYGMRQMRWDEELALFAQVSANYCRVQTDLCRTTDAYPNPDQYSSVVRFTHPDWQLVGDNQYTSVNNLTEDKVSYVINSVLNEMYHGKDQVTRSRIDKHYGSNIYLTMVYGWSTHIGCGMTTFVSFDQRKKFNDVVFVCNFSHQPTVGQKVYETDPPHKERVKLGWSEKCGCDPGLDEREDCLCIGNVPGCLLEWHCQSNPENKTVINNLNDITNITNPARMKITDANNINLIDNISNNYNVTATATSKLLDDIIALSTNTRSKVPTNNTFNPVTDYSTTEPISATFTKQKWHIFPNVKNNNDLIIDMITNINASTTNTTAKLIPDITSQWPSPAIDPTLNDTIRLSVKTIKVESTINTTKESITNNVTAPVTSTFVKLTPNDNIKLITDVTNKSILNAINELNNNVATVGSTNTTDTIVEMTTNIIAQTIDTSGEIATNKTINQTFNTTDESIDNTFVEPSINNADRPSTYNITIESTTNMIIDTTTDIVGELITHANKLPTKSTWKSIFNSVTKSATKKTSEEYKNITKDLIKLDNNKINNDITTTHTDAYITSPTAINFTTSIIKLNTNELTFRLTSNTGDLIINTSTELKTNHVQELTIEPIIKFTELYSNMTFKLTEKPNANAMKIISDAVNRTHFTLINSASDLVNTDQFSNAPDGTTSRILKKTANMPITNSTIEQVHNISNKTTTAITKKEGMKLLIYITKPNKNPAPKINSLLNTKSNIVRPMLSSWNQTPDPYLRPKEHHSLIPVLNEYLITTRSLPKTTKSLLSQDQTLLQVLLSPPRNTLLGLISQPLIPSLKQLIMPLPNELPYQLQKPPYIINNMPIKTSTTSFTKPCSCDAKYLVLWKALEKITKLHEKNEINEVNLKLHSKKAFQNNTEPRQISAIKTKPIKIRHKPLPDQRITKSNATLLKKLNFRNNAKDRIKPASKTKGSKTLFTKIKTKATYKVSDDSVIKPSTTIIKQIINYNNTKVRGILATTTEPQKKSNKNKLKFTQKTITTKPYKWLTSKNNTKLRNYSATKRSKKKIATIATTNPTGIKKLINKQILNNNTTAINKVATNTKPRKKSINKNKTNLTVNPTNIPARRAIKRNLKKNAGPIRMPATNTKLNKKRNRAQIIKTNTKPQNLSLKSSTKLIRKPATNIKPRKKQKTTVKTVKKTLQNSIIKQQNKKIATPIKPPKKSVSISESTKISTDMRKKILRRSSVLNSVPTDQLPDFLKLIELQERCLPNDPSCISVNLNIPQLPVLDEASREKQYELGQSMLNQRTMKPRYFDNKLEISDIVMDFNQIPREASKSHTSIQESDDDVKDMLQMLVDENAILNVNENEGSIKNSHINILNDVDAEKKYLLNSPNTMNQNFALTERPNNTFGETKNTMIADLHSYENEVLQGLNGAQILPKEIYLSYLPQEEEDTLLRNSLFKSTEGTDNDYNSNSIRNSLMINRQENINIEDSIQTTERSYYALKPNVEQNQMNQFNSDELSESVYTTISEEKFSASTKKESIFRHVPRLKLPSQNYNNEYALSKVSSAETKYTNAINLLYDTEENSVLTIQTPIAPQNQNDLPSDETNMNVVVERLGAAQGPFKTGDELLQMPEFKQIESDKDYEEKLRNYNDFVYNILKNEKTEFIDSYSYTMTKSPLQRQDAPKRSLNNADELLQRHEFEKTDSDNEYSEKRRNYNHDVSNIKRNGQTQFIDSHSYTITNILDNAAAIKSKTSLYSNQNEGSVVLQNSVQPNLSNKTFLPTNKESIFRIAPKFKLSAVSKQAKTKDNTTTKLDIFDIVHLLDNSEMRPIIITPNVLTYTDTALNKSKNTAIPLDKSTDNQQINVEIEQDTLRNTKEINFNENHNLNTLLYAIEPKPKKPVFQYASNNEIDRNSNIKRILSFVSSSVEEDNEVKLNNLLNKIDKDIIGKNFKNTVEPKVKKIYGYIFQDTV